MRPLMGQRRLRNPILRARVDGIWKGLSRSLRTLDVHDVPDCHPHYRCRVARFAITNNS
jgi:hypothetical protein